MIHKIRLENFYCFSTPQELNFLVPTNAPDSACFRESLYKKNLRVPLTMGFFGPNASGKSTVLKAVQNIFFFACYSFYLEPGKLAQLFQTYRHPDYFNKPTKVAIEFEGQLSEQAPTVLFRYELEIENHSIDNKSVLYEALSFASKGRFRRLFERHKQSIEFGQSFEAKPYLKEGVAPTVSVLSTLAQLNHSLSRFILNKLGIMQTLETNIPDQEILKAYQQDKELFSALNQEIQRLDMGLESIQIVASQDPVPQDPVYLLYHTGLENPLFFWEESLGTQRFIQFFLRLYYGLKQGAVIVIDELDSKFHPFLLSELLRWFYDPERNPLGAQLFFTAHNPALLDELQKEQIFLTEKPIGQSAFVYCAADIQGLRREPSLMKKYLGGELGAVPHI